MSPSGSALNLSPITADSERSSSSKGTAPAPARDAWRGANLRGGTQGRSTGLDLEREGNRPAVSRGAVEQGRKEVQLLGACLADAF